jgi:single-strand DNA-binding protein
MSTITLSGYVSADPQIRDAGATKVLGLRIPVKTGFADRERTTWYSVSVFGKRAEGLAKIVRKGTYLTISGELSMREYEHNGEKRVSLDVDSYRETLGPKTGDAPVSSSAPQTDDEIPF